MDSAYDIISAFSPRNDNQEAVFGAEEGLKDIRYSNSNPALHFTFLKLRDSWCFFTLSPFLFFFILFKEVGHLTNLSLSLTTLEKFSWWDSVGVMFLDSLNAFY